MNSCWIDWEKITRDFLSSRKLRQVAELRGFYRVNPSGIPRIPPDLELRDYQNTAIISWFRNRGRGTLKMATGSGKTITALATYRHLVNQWQREAEKFNLKPILAYESVHTWQSQLATELYNVQAGNQKFVTILTTNSTFISEGFQSQIKFFPDKTLIVGDEAHNLGSPRLEELLPRSLGLRLALSATPERYFDEEGTRSFSQLFLLSSLG